MTTPTSTPTPTTNAQLTSFLTPNHAATLQKLTPIAAKLYLILLTKSDLSRNVPLVRTAITDLALSAGLSTRQAWRAIRTLQSNWFIERVPRTYHGVNTYLFTRPKPTASTPWAPAPHTPVTPLPTQTTVPPASHESPNDVPPVVQTPAPSSPATAQNRTPNPIPSALNGHPAPSVSSTAKTTPPPLRATGVTVPPPAPALQKPPRAREVLKLILRNCPPGFEALLTTYLEKQLARIIAS